MRVIIKADSNIELAEIADDLSLAGMPDFAEAELLAPVDVKVSRLADRFPMWQISKGVTDDLLRTAEVNLPHLAVVMAPGDEPVEKRALSHLRCSLRLVKSKKRLRGGPARLLVGFDGSNGAIHAVNTVTSRVWPGLTEVKLIAAADAEMIASIGRFNPDIAGVAAEAEYASKWIKTLAAGSVRRLENKGLTVTVESRLGRPVDVLSNEAKRWGADTLFVGSSADVNRQEASRSALAFKISAASQCTVELCR